MQETESAQSAGETTDFDRDRLVHDLNNVLASMLANLHLALARLENDHKARERIEAANRSAVRMRDLLQSISDSR
jgi:outer membrane murein-binding lipoprotein Lpp